MNKPELTVHKPIEWGVFDNRTLVCPFTTGQQVWIKTPKHDKPFLGEYCKGIIVCIAFSKLDAYLNVEYDVTKRDMFCTHITTIQPGDEIYTLEEFKQSGGDTVEQQ